MPRATKIAPWQHRLASWCGPSEARGRRPMPCARARSCSGGNRGGRGRCGRSGVAVPSSDPMHKSVIDQTELHVAQAVSMFPQSSVTLSRPSLFTKGLMLRREDPWRGGRLQGRGRHEAVRPAPMQRTRADVMGITVCPPSVSLTPWPRLCPDRGREGEAGEGGTPREGRGRERVSARGSERERGRGREGCTARASRASALLHRSAHATRGAQYRLPTPRRASASAYRLRLRLPPSRPPPPSTRLPCGGGGDRRRWRPRDQDVTRGHYGNQDVPAVCRTCSEGVFHTEGYQFFKSALPGSFLRMFQNRPKNLSGTRTNWRMVCGRGPGATRRWGRRTGGRGRGPTAATVTLRMGCLGGRPDSADSQGGRPWTGSRSTFNTGSWLRP